MDNNLFDLKQVQGICTSVAKNIQCDLSFLDREGEILASTIKGRIGMVNEIALELVNNKKEYLAISGELAHSSPLLIEGLVFPLDLHDSYIAYAELITTLDQAEEKLKILSGYIHTLFSNLQYKRRNRELQDQFNDYIDTVDVDWTWEMDSSFRFTSFVDHKWKMTNIPLDRIVGKTCWELAGVDVDRNIHWKEHKEILETHKSFRDFRCELKITQEKKFYVSVNGKPLHDSSGTFIGYRGATIDITEKIRLEMLRRRRSKVLELLAKKRTISEILTVLVEMSEELHPGMIGSVLIFDEDSCKLLHGAAPSLPGFYTDAINGMLIGEGVGSCGTAAFRKERVVVSDISTHPFWNKAKGIARKAGVQACWSQPILSSTGMVLGTFAMYYKEKRNPAEDEIGFIEETANLAGIAIEKVRSDTEILLLQSRLKNVINSMPSVMIGVDADCNVTLWSEKATHLTGYSQGRAQGHPLVSIIKDLEPYSDRIRQSINNKQVATFTFRKETDRYGSQHFEVVIYPLAAHTYEKAVIRIEDVSDRVSMEEKTHQRQKLEAIGQLAGGVAHDFNNILMGITGRVSLLKEENNVVPEHLEAIEEYVESATALTRQLLGTARGGKYNPQPTDLNQLITDSAEMFGRTRKDVRIIRQLSQIPVVSEVDEQQIAQVLLNMYLNAWQAMPNGGELKISTTSVFIDIHKAKLYQLLPGEYARLSISDNGVGMDSYTCRHVFDPFFTTKKKERGTGLGLASAYGIIKNHGGFIEVDSALGRGTVFTVFLPLSYLEPSRKTADKKEIVSGNETILLVDDEDMIIDVAQAMLERIGYNVISAKGGRDAVKIVESSDSAIDLVILDLIMPEMDGEKTYDHIRQISPSIPIILSSGYSLDSQARRVMNKGCNGYIQKPFSLSAISQAIRRALENK